MSFKNYLDLIKKPSIVYNFSRMNPMHKEHYDLVKFMLEYSKKHKYIINPGS